MQRFQSAQEGGEARPPDLRRSGGVAAWCSRTDRRRQRRRLRRARRGGRSAERCEQFAHGREARRRILGEATLQRLAVARRQVRRQRRRRRRVLLHHLPRVVADERRLAAQQFVEDAAQRVDVAAAVAAAVEHFGGHVVRRAARRRQAGAAAVGELRQAEVPHARDVALEEDVLRLDVEVHEAVVVQRLHAGRRLREPRAQPREVGGRGRRAPWHAIAQRLAAGERHHHERDAVDEPAVLDGDEVGMVDLREVAQLVEFGLHRARDLGVVDLQELDGVVLADRRLAGPVDLARHAAAELAEDLVAAHVPRLAQVAVERLPVGRSGGGVGAHAGTQCSRPARRIAPPRRVSGVSRRIVRRPRFPWPWRAFANGSHRR